MNGTPTASHYRPVISLNMARTGRLSALEVLKKELPGVVKSTVSELEVLGVGTLSRENPGCRGGVTYSGAGTGRLPLDLIPTLGAV